MSATGSSDKPTTPPGWIPLDIASALPARHGFEHLSIRVEGLLKGARLSAGRDNGDRTWSLSRDELDDLAYLPSEDGFDPHTLSIRVLGFDGNVADTIALFDMNIATDAAPPKPPEQSPAPSEDSPAIVAKSGDACDKDSQADRPGPEALYQAEAEARIAEARAEVEAQAELRIAEARRMIESEADQRLKAARAAWQEETERRLTEAEAALEAEKQRLLEAAAAKERAMQEEKRAGLHKRVMAAEARAAAAECETNRAKAALTEALERSGHAVAAREESLSRARDESRVEIQSLRDELAAAKAAVRAYESELEAARRKVEEELAAEHARNLEEIRERHASELERRAEEAEQRVAREWRTRLVDARAEWEREVVAQLRELEKAAQRSNSGTNGGDEGTPAEEAGAWKLEEVQRLAEVMAMWETGQKSARGKSDEHPLTEHDRRQEGTPPAQPAQEAESLEKVDAKRGPRSRRWGLPLPLSSSARRQKR